MPHSFTSDGPYRIAKRAGGGQTVTFEFRASAKERFYCNLTQDERCNGMHGELMVKSRIPPLTDLAARTFRSPN